MSNVPESDWTTVARESASLMLGIAGVMLAACGVAFGVAVVWGGV